MYHDENSESQVSSTTGNAVVFASLTNVSPITYNNEYHQSSTMLSSTNHSNAKGPHQPQQNRVVLGERNNTQNIPFKNTNKVATSVVKKIVNRGRWSKEEDLELKRLVDIHGEQWARVSSYFSDRNEVQCQQRWGKVLNPKLIKGPWTQAVS